MATFLLRVKLPDRPGALGAVASRIGAVRADVVDMEIAERGLGSAVDEFVVNLTDEDRLSLLLSEVAEVDGVSVEAVRPVSGSRRDPGIQAYGCAIALLAQHTPHDVLTAVAQQACEALDASWSGVVDLQDGALVASSGTTPAAPWLAAYIAARRPSASSDDPHAQPCTRREIGDVTFADLAAWDLVLVAGRPGWPFSVSERSHLTALAQLADVRWADMTQRQARIAHPSRAG
jgi:hypothetical protein